LRLSITCQFVHLMRNYPDLNRDTICNDLLKRLTHSRLDWSRTPQFTPLQLFPWNFHRISMDSPHLRCGMISINEKITLLHKCHTESTDAAFKWIVLCNRVSFPELLSAESAITAAAQMRRHAAQMRRHAVQMRRHAAQVRRRAAWCEKVHCGAECRIPQRCPGFFRVLWLICILRKSAACPLC
jgi:hypothetical protein